MKYLIMLFIVVGLTPSIAQTSLKTLPISISYYGDNAIHAGLKLGTQYKLFSKEKSKAYRLQKRNTKYGTKLKLKEYYIDYNLGLYSFPNSYTGYFTNIGLSYLRTKTNRKNRQFGFSFEIGYLHRRYKFDTYELINGEIESSKGGNNAFQVSFSPSFGKEFTVAENTIRFYFKPIAQLVSYTHTIRPNFALESGLIFNIKR